jgi:hypothetical protein
VQRDATERPQEEAAERRAAKRARHRTTHLDWRMRLWERDVRMVAEVANQ